MYSTQPMSPSIPNKWENTDISAFYEHIPIALLREYAEHGGLEAGPDVEVVYPYIAHTSSLIDVGSAYGRVIKKLLAKNYGGTIYALERSSQFCAFLRKTYQDRIIVIEEAIQNFTPSQPVDAVLWLWSGIGDFAQSEQLSILKRITPWLKPTGFLILETMPHDMAPKNATYNDAQDFVLTSPYGTAYGYKTSKAEIQHYATALGFKHLKQIDYTTTTHRPRILHVLTNASI